MKRESWLEIGLVTFVIAILGAIGVGLAGRASGSVDRNRRHRLPPPDPGSVSERSHQNISSSAAR
jgi:hypothetical protein